MNFCIPLFINCCLLAFSSAQNPYCNIASCADKNSHTMCKYSSKDVGAACGESYQVGLTKNEKDSILRTHNMFRKHVAIGQEHRGNPGPQPAAVAGAMKVLSWNNELEKIAQTWANQCDFNHDECRNTAEYVVGQNIGIVYSSNTAAKFNVTDLVTSWYNEVTKFDKNGVNKYVFDSSTGHYTQLVWGDTSLIGCGWNQYVKDGWAQGYLVCNYAPSGNWIGQPIYKT